MTATAVPEQPQLPLPKRVRWCACVGRLGRCPIGCDATCTEDMKWKEVTT